MKDNPKKRPHIHKTSPSNQNTIFPGAHQHGCVEESRPIRALVQHPNPRTSMRQIIDLNAHKRLTSFDTPNKSKHHKPSSSQQPKLSITDEFESSVNSTSKGGSCNNQQHHPNSSNKTQIKDEHNHGITNPEECTQIHIIERDRIPRSI